MTFAHARIGLAAITMCLLATAGSAQQGLRSASLPDRTPPPLPSASPDLFLADANTYSPRPPRRDNRRYRRDWYASGGVYGLPYADDYPYYSDRRFAPRQWPGYLQLQVTPTTALVFVDGLYVGSVNDVRQSAQGYALEPGAHRLELRAPGYQVRSVDLRIDSNETRIYRSDLDPIASAERPPPRVVAAAPPKTLYVIPGCYAGDKPPQADRLRPGCSISKTRTVPPVLNVAR